MANSLFFMPKLCIYNYNSVIRCMNALIYGLILLMFIRSCNGFISKFSRALRSPRGAAVLARRPLSVADRHEGDAMVASRAVASLSAVEGAADSAISTSSPRRKRVLSGIQPSGSLHLGNYLGNSIFSLIHHACHQFICPDPLYRRIEAVGVRSGPIRLLLLRCGPARDHLHGGATSGGTAPVDAPVRGAVLGGW